MSSMSNPSRRGVAVSRKSLLCRVALCVAWADGDVSAEELRHLKEALQVMAGIHRGEVEKLAGAQAVMDEKLRAGLKSLPPGDACDILKLAFRIANADRSINDEELGVIRQVASVILPNKPWELVHAWIGAQLDFINATKALFKQ
jgi:uncharacterized tellurite resistance protein B-like protein